MNEFFDSIYDIPNYRKFLASEFLLYSTYGGNSLQDIQDRILECYNYIANNRIDLASTALQNMDIAVESIKQKQDWELLELVCYAKIIDNQELPIKLTTKDIYNWADKLNATGITTRFVKETLENIKKKSIENLKP